MIRGEKVYSFVKFEHEIEPTYREKLANAKKKAEVREVFELTLLELLKSISNEFEKFTQEDIKFEPKKLEFSDELKKKVEEFSKNSDLHAIIERMYEAAQHRYQKIENDENTDYFNIKTK